MVSDAIYELCLPLLEDTAVDDEDRTEQLEQLVQKEASLTGQPLEDAVLTILWRFRDSKDPSKSSAPVRHTIIRKSSPAPWQAQASSPVASPSLASAVITPPPGLGSARTGYVRAKSFNASQWTGPRPAPQLAFASHIPHSPTLSSYEFHDAGAVPNDYGDYGSDTVDWLVNDEAYSRPSSSGAGSAYDCGLNGAAAAWIQPQQHEMSPYDILRSVLGDGKTDEEIESALEANGYDLSAAMMSLMGTQVMYPQDQSYGAENGGQIVIGKSMLTNAPLAIEQPGRSRSGIVCKYWLANGSCLRADCRFSHDLSSHICKYVKPSGLAQRCVTDFAGIGSWATAWRENPASSLMIRRSWSTA
jgi:hypothetical protein